jgi:hypothetical protein
MSVRPCRAEARSSTKKHRIVGEPEREVKSFTADLMRKDF